MKIILETLNLGSKDSKLRAFGGWGSTPASSLHRASFEKPKPRGDAGAPAPPNGEVKPFVGQLLGPCLALEELTFKLDPRASTNPSYPT